MENKSLSKKKIILISIVGVIIIVFVINAISSSTSSTTVTTASDHIGLGEQGTLQTKGTQTTIVAVSKDAYDKLLKTLGSGDSVGYTELSQAGLVYEVDNGTKVLVIDSTWGDTQIRFLNGKYVGKTAWVGYESISPK